MNDIDHMIAVLTAAKEGKAIQRRHRTHRDIDGFWKDVRSLHWNWADFDYRVKPAEPRRIWVNMYNDYMGFAHSSREQADANAGVNRVECVEFVEVVR